MSIKAENITYQYNIDDSCEEKTGIFNITFDIDFGKIVSVIGHTGSGKSTLMQTLNGLYLPQSGCLSIGNIIVNRNSKNLNDLRRKVGMVFQYPEDQLFEETIYKDISFGPRNLGLCEYEIDKNVKKAMKDMELDFEFYKDLSPHEISGGEKRKVAIASVLAMNSEILVLDEPTAGLDPKSKKDLLNILFNLKEKRKLTIFFVSHDMDDVLNISDIVLVLNNGKIILNDTVDNVFRKYKCLKKLGLEYPFSIDLLILLNKTKKFNFNIEPYKIEKLSEVILKDFKRG